LPGSSANIAFPVLNQGARTLVIDSARIQNHGNVITVTTPTPLTIPSGGLDTIHILWSPDTTIILRDTLFLFHNDPEIENPMPIELTGSSVPTPLLYVNTTQVNFGLVDVNVPSRDTTLYVYNIGTADDSVYITLNYQLVQPPSALQAGPEAFSISPGDSQAVTFTFYPPLIVRTGLSIYAPIVKVDSRFGAGTTHFEKKMNFRLTGTLDVVGEGSVPHIFSLEQNYPNPFNPTTTIVYGVESRESIELKVFDVLGQEVATLVNEVQDAGFKSVEWDARDVASGVYVYRLKAGDVVLSRMMMAVK
jgi:hypothetical protein